MPAQGLSPSIQSKGASCPTRKESWAAPPFPLSVLWCGFLQEVKTHAQGERRYVRLDIKMSRSDLLKRHIRLSSKCKAAVNDEQRPASNVAANPEPDHLQLADTLESAAAASGLRNDIYEGLGSSFTAVASREELERLYFCHFHPHWPLLDEASFTEVPQIRELVTSVLVAGLWMVPTRSARLEARRRHDILMQEVVRRLVCTHWTHSTDYTSEI
jgi:hypothetical protein